MGSNESCLCAVPPALASAVVLVLFMTLPLSDISV
jgi:hypothetical protein